MKILKVKNFTRKNEIIAKVHEVCEEYPVLWYGDNDDNDDIKITPPDIEIIQGIVMVYITNNVDEDIKDQKIYDRLLYEYISEIDTYFVSGNGDTYLDVILKQSHKYFSYTVKSSYDEEAEDFLMADGATNEIGKVFVDLISGKIRVHTKGQIGFYSDIVEEVIEALNSSCNTKSARKL